MSHAKMPTDTGFRSEQVAGFLLECMAGFVGIRTSMNGEQTNGVENLAAIAKAKISCRK